MGTFKGLCFPPATYKWLTLCGCFERVSSPILLSDGWLVSHFRMASTTPHVMVVSAEGYFYLYSIDLDNGGECSLTKQYRYVPVVPPARPVNSLNLQSIGLYGRGRD